MTQPADAIARLRLLNEAFGTKGLRRRLGYVLQLRSGVLRRRLPARSTFDHEAELPSRASSIAIARAIAAPVCYVSCVTVVRRDPAP